MVTTASELMANQVSAKVETQAAVGSDARIYHLTALDMSHMLEGNTEESRKTTGSIPGYMSEGRANGASVIRPDSFNFLKVLGKGNYGKVIFTWIDICTLSESVLGHAGYIETGRWSVFRSESH